MKLTATTRPLDRKRTYRAMIAWLDGDLYALNTLLDEVMADRVGTPSLVFELLEVATSAAEELDADIRDHLRDALLQFEDPSS